MRQVADHIFVAGEAACTPGTAEQAVVHACKHPCHQRAVGYTGHLPPTHPHYLVLERNNDLFLNLIDPEIPLFKRESFQAFRTLAKRHWREGRTLLIHCNQGESRAPGLAILFLAKDLQLLPNNSFRDAALAFGTHYPSYRPGNGISRFLTDHWVAL